jgi:hypothetical protein
MHALSNWSTPTFPTDVTANTSIFQTHGDAERWKTFLSSALPTARASAIEEVNIASVLAQWWRGARAHLRFGIASMRIGRMMNRGYSIAGRWLLRLLLGREIHRYIDPPDTGDARWCEAEFKIALCDLGYWSIRERCHPRLSFHPPDDRIGLRARMRLTFTARSA